MQEISTTTTQSKETPADKIVRPLTSPKSADSKLSPKTILILFLLVFLGVVSGFLLYKQQTQGTVRLAGKNVEVVNLPSEEGVKDASTFKDTATGTLQLNDGKITTEGTHILVRGDASQNVYLTSSVVDLSKYVGKKVQVWGRNIPGAQSRLAHGCGSH